MLVKARRHDDRGSTLVSVMVAMLVLVAIALTTATVTFNTTRGLVTTRSTAQARAAADAGLAALVAHARRTNDFCDLTLPVPSAGPSASPSPDVPHYKATSNPQDLPEGGCKDEKVTFQSTGFAADGSQATIVAEYQVIKNTAPPTAGGPGLFYTYDAASRFNGYVFNKADSEVGIDEFVGAASVYAHNAFTTGKIACGSGSVFAGDLYIKTGGLQLDAGCVVEGNAYVGGVADINGGTIEGNLVAPSNSEHLIRGTIGKAGGGSGNVFLGGTFTLHPGLVYGSVQAAGSGNNTLGSGTIHGNLTYKGSYSTWGTPASTIVKGTLAKDTGLTAPSLPEIPPWQDVEFTPVNATTPPQAWADAGYKLTTVTGTACNKWSTYTADPNSMTSSLSSRMIFDLRGCSGGFSTNETGNKDVAVNHDVAIIANYWYLSGTKLKSADGQPHTIYLITPDSQPTVAGRQCNSPAKDSEQGNGSKVDPKLAVYIYTPCQMKFNDSSSTFRGQVYAGKLDFGGGVKVAFAPRNIPGYDFGKDVDPWPGGGGGAGALILGALQSQRDVA